MVGMGESYFSAYALALGLGPTAAALMVTLPVLMGATLQLATPWGVRKVGSHKRWVVAGIMTQVACLLMLPLAVVFVNTAAAMIAFGAVAFYWAAGLAGNPAWNTWMEELVPLRVRTRFFACRQRTAQFCVLSAFVLGGLALQLGRSSGRELLVFTAIFLVAALSRFISGCFVASQSEPSRGKMIEEERVSFWDLFATGGKTAGGGLVVYLLAMQVAVQISGPYFTPFLLKQEELSYFTYMVLIGLGFAGKVIASPMWGRVGQRIGAVRLLWAGGLAIVPISGLWIFSDYFATTELRFSLPFAPSLGTLAIPGQVLYLSGVQILSGTSWAAYELAMVLMFLHGIPRKQRTSMLTLYNFGNSAAMVMGGLIGALVLRSFGESHNTYLLLFMLSSCVRLAMVPLLARVKG
jgi:MFS family permease